MSKISSSPNRYTFGKKKHEEKLIEDPDNEVALGWIKFYDDRRQDNLTRLNEIENKKNDLEYDLRSIDWILEKVRASEIYAQNLYAALCNNEFIRREMWPILKDERWSCSWRYAGGIIADMREEGDYIDWYCSGISGGLSYDDELALGKVAESVVTEEVKDDLHKLGWIVITDNE